MSVLFSYIFQCSKKDKIFLSILLCIVGSFLVCSFLGSVATYEKDQMKIVYSSSAFRLIMVYGFAIFNVFFVSRMVQTREIETFIAGPVQRSSIITSLLLVNIVLVISLCVAIGFALKVFFWNIIPFANICFWCLSLFLEVMIVVSISIFFGIMLSNATLCIILITIFYIVARIIGFILTSITLALQGFSLMGVIKTLIIPISIFFPRIDLFTQSQWLIYENSVQNTLLITIQGVVYIGMIAYACIVDFNRKSI